MSVTAATFGDPRLPDRFWSKVAPIGGHTDCWIWIGAHPGGTGYGSFHFNGRGTLAHRVSFQMLVGPIPEGLQIDHLCRIRTCVNPAHMEAVTLQENVRRAVPYGFKLNQTHCIHGHEFNEDNTYARHYRGREMRECRTCRNNRHNERRRSPKELAA